MSFAVGLILISLLATDLASAQVLKRRPESQHEPRRPAALTTTRLAVPLVIPAGTPLKIAMVQEVRIRKAGQSIRGRIEEPVYVFDAVVIPTGTEARGRISEIAGVSKKNRTAAAMNADFSPARKVRVTFDELQLPDGRQVAIHADALPGSSGVLQFVSAAARKPSRTEAARNTVSRRILEAKQQLRQGWESAKAQLHQPGKIRRLERLGIAQLPYRPQYLEAGTIFNASLQQPLNFGQRVLSADSLAGIGTTPPAGSLVRAELLTALSSATNKRGDLVEAAVTAPVFADKRLVLPEGSRLEGRVSEVRPARLLARNGLLRIQFQKIVPPDGVEQTITASLDAVEVSQKEHLTLDSEGGAQATAPKTRYFSTALSVVVAASSMSSDNDRDGALHGGGDGGNGAVTGISGFRLVGMFAGAIGRSRVLSRGLGFYGAGRSLYSHFLARGHEVVYPKDMSMLVGLGKNPHGGSSSTQDSQHN
jgi:type IV secretory pathway VirB10-like protein